MIWVVNLEFSSSLKLLLEFRSSVWYGLVRFFGEPALPCEDPISQLSNNMTLYQDHYLKRLRALDTTDKWFWLNNKDRIVEHISYFKLQAKNLLRDYKSRTSYVDKSTGAVLCQYAPKFFDIDGIFLDYDWPDADFSLMKAQHLIALMVGFKKWPELLNASDAELELARLLFENQHKIGREDWEMYVMRAEIKNDIIFDVEDRISIFKKIFLNVEGHASPFGSYRLDPKK